MIVLATTAATLLIGFLAGLFTVKRSERWCATHGITKTCPLCELPAAARSNSCRG
jgi:hypothetical protein